MTDDFDKKVQLIEEEKNDRGQGEEADNSGYFAEDEELYDCSQGAIALERVNKVTLSIGLSEYPTCRGTKMNSFTRPIQPCIMQRTWEKTRYISIRTR